MKQTSMAKHQSVTTVQAVQLQRHLAVTAQEQSLFPVQTLSALLVQKTGPSHLMVFQSRLVFRATAMLVQSQVSRATLLSLD